MKHRKGSAVVAALACVAAVWAACGEGAADPAPAGVVDAGADVDDEVEDVELEAPDLGEEVGEVDAPGGEDVAVDVVDEPVEEVGEEGCAVAWVSMGDFEIFKYEASRSDATASDQGSAVGAACSVAGVVPWTQVTWLEARASCEAAGARLCLGVEWDGGCRGAGRAIFPYGQTYDPQACNTLESPDGCLMGNCQVVATGSYPACVSEGGAFDMSGNVAEWVEDQRPFGEEAYDVRGGSYLSSDDNTIRCRNANLSRAPGFTNPDLGFRCCR